LARTLPSNMACINGIFALQEEIPEAPSSSSGTVAFSTATFISTDGRITKHNIQTRVKNKSKRFIIAFADTVGRRANMEDDFFIGGQYRGSSDEDFIAIFDGHAGPDVAHYAAYQLPITMQEVMKKNNNVQLCFKKAFQEINQQLKQKKILGGTTVLSCYFHQQELYVANLGDCRAVALNADGKSVRLTRDHRPDAPEEQRRIEKLGGEVTTAVTKEGKLVSRVNGVLGVARALGDFDLEPFVNPEPEVFVFHPQSEKHNFRAIVIACDGLWDVVCVTQFCFIGQLTYCSFYFIFFAARGPRSSRYNNSIFETTRGGEGLFTPAQCCLCSRQHRQRDGGRDSAVGSRTNHSTQKEWQVWLVLGVLSSLDLLSI